ncbi:histidinol-phosphatase [Taibaiella sp. KBW10]|uniref:DNA polymerase/3'-5' exonuclease PolX n=1 Tax=Taibaiella sp. KBW10 TaxID=2153357 RepID=UPI000F59D791|nr:DNA polymerase/3'-5' exonuclease PolX [Taibaiella sp. KBW10]RQO30002.1 histidinol-phosphatase [Taibaiella sp. KBW10]
MTNHDIADHFELLAKLMDIHNEDSFKAKSYASAAFRIEKVPEPLSELSVEALKALPAIGASLAAKIHELNTTGHFKLLDDYLQKTPPGVVDMLSIKGIGPKKISLLWKELGLESIGELEYACQENRLVTVKGFGAKTQQSILDSIAFIKSNSGFCLYAEADALLSTIMDYYRVHFPEALISPTAAFRQQHSTLSQIDLVTNLSVENICAAFQESVYEQEVIDERHFSITVAGLPALVFTLVSNDAQFYTHLFNTSGSAAFLEGFANRFVLPEDLKSEQEIFTKNGLAYVHPALRESEAILQVAQEHALPELIMPGDIKGIIHSHSTYSDGQHTLAQMAQAAKDKGYAYLVISDHSQAAFYANGLSPERIKQQHEEIDLLNQKLAPFKIFKSIEADILNDGQLDYTDEILSTFDLVIASVHSNLKMSEEKAMQRILTAVQHPATRILGHPTGRLLLSRAGYPLDHKTLIDACAAHKVVIEINAHPRRLDLDWTWIEYALSQNVLLSINPDAHSIDGMDLVKYGVLAAQKGGLAARQNLSSFDLPMMEQFLKNYK